MSADAPGAQNPSMRSASLTTWSRSCSGPNSSMVSVALLEFLASRHSPATNPSIRTDAGEVCR